MLLSEWSKYDHTKFEQKNRENQQEIPLNDKNLLEEKAEEEKIEKLNKEGKIDQKQKEALVRTKEYIARLFRNKPDCQKKMFDLVEKNTLGKISLEEEELLLEFEVNPPDNYSPDNDEDIKTALLKFLTKIKNKISRLLVSKKEINNNNDRP